VKFNPDVESVDTIYAYWAIFDMNEIVRAELTRLACLRLSV